LYLALIGSVLAYFWWNKGVATLGAGHAAIFINFIPVATIIISLFFREPVGLTQAAGCLLIIVAVMLTAADSPDREAAG
ncbi:MAG: DMT family transporter, partial [Firmicutes bacterium]|nr:DMT family transporter [Bacillota bacterium]